VINVNSHQTGAIAAMVGSAIQKESVATGGPGFLLAPTLVGPTDANNAGTSLASLAIPGTSKAGLAALIRNETGFGPSAPKTERESIARALGEADQTRTWNLLIDVIAQSGRYPPNATSFQNGFVVEGEQRYWVHVAIDRFTGQVIDKQIEPVNE
jgi:hypothetical protein